MSKSKRVVKVRRDTNKQRRRLIGKKSKVARTHRVSRKRNVKKGGTDGDKKVVLLIIDPQNDFSDNTQDATLPVAGATADYAKIVNFITKMGNKLSEIHVSLDTHTPGHIGHKNFWKRTDAIEELNSSDTLRQLSINEAGVISGKSIIPGVTDIRTYVPSNAELTDYVSNYLQFFNDPARNTHKQNAWIWPDHCIEGTEGHKVHPILQVALDSDGVLSKVKYHIKGQNNLAEMYSIFSAENPVVESSLSSNLIPLQYSGSNTEEGGEAPTYAAVSKLKNINTQLNEKLLSELLGPKENPNVIFICGQAKTHCVKSSTIDLLDYADKNGYSTENIILLSDATSPIIGSLNDIEEIVHNRGGVLAKTIYESLYANTPSNFNPTLFSGYVKGLRAQYKPPVKP